MYKTMKAYSNIFPTVYINFIKTGELTNNLDTLLKQAITYLEDEQKITEKIKTDLVPSIIMFIGVLILILFAIICGIPSFQNIIESNGFIITLPKITILISNFINYIIKYWYMLIILIITIFVVIYKYIIKPKGKYKYNYFKYNNFLFGKLTYLIDFTRILRSIFLNVQNNMRLQDALEISKNVTNNTYMISKIEESISNLYIGKNWILPFENEKNLSIVILEMIKKAYSTQSLETLERTINYLEKEIELETNRVLKKIPEISYIFVGLALLLFLLLFLIPCIQIYFGGFLFI